MSSSTGDVLWRQENETPILEITTSLILPHGATPRDISVNVSEEGLVLTIKYQQATLLSWKLWRAVDTKEQPEWTFENGKICILLVKGEAEQWSQLVGWTLPISDPAFVDENTINKLYAAEVPSLPPPKVEELDDEPAATEKKKETSKVEELPDSESWDKVEDKEQSSSAREEKDEKEENDEEKEEAPKKAEEDEEKKGDDEATDDKKKEEDAAVAEDKKTEEEIDLDELVSEIDAEQHPIIKLELSGLEEESKEILSKRKEYEETLASGKNSEGEELSETERTELERRIDILRRLAEFNRKMRLVRSRPCTLENFFEHQRIEIAKGRTNAGDLDDVEVEMYNDDEERAMSGDDLLGKGMESLKKKTREDFKAGIRYLRLAALHKHDAHAAVILFNLYTEMEEFAKACWFITRRAQMDDCEPMTNSLCGSLHDEGVRLFPPWMALSLYYHQRAASSGSASSMLQLANLWQRGCTNGAKTLLANPQHAKLALANSDSSKFLKWINHAEARASGSAFFAKCQLHMSGDLEECDRNYHKAVKYWKRAVAAMPDFQKLGPRIEMQFEAMRRELGISEAQSGSPADSKAPSFADPNQRGINKALASSGSPTGPAGGQRAGAGGMGRSMGSRLGALERQGGNVRAGMDMSGPQSAGAARAQSAGESNRKFWETAVKTGVTLFGVYMLSFPLRVAILPQFYGIIEMLKNIFFGALLGGGGRGGSGRVGGMRGGPMMM